MTSDGRSMLGRRVAHLLARLQVDSSESRQIVAYLRRSPAKLSEAPDAWQFIYRGVEEDDVLPDKAYQAIYTALQFYALHKRKNLSPHQYKSEGGMDIANALALYRKLPDGKNIDTKVSAILTTTDVVRTVRLLEPLFVRAVSRINSRIDYVDFAHQINALQYPSSSRKVLLGWGKSYYKNTFIKSEEKN